MSWAKNSSLSILDRYSLNAPILLPITGPATLKLGFNWKFIYFCKSCSNWTSFIFNSSCNRFFKSPIKSWYFPSTRTLFNGCLTLIFSFSLTPLPKVTNILISSILFSVFSSIKVSSHTGKWARWTDSSPVKLTYNSSDINGANGAMILLIPTSKS